MVKFAIYDKTVLTNEIHICYNKFIGVYLRGQKATETLLFCLRVIFRCVAWVKGIDVPLEKKRALPMSAFRAVCKLTIYLHQKTVFYMF